MHLPDGLLGLPTCLATWLVAAAAVGFACYRLRGPLGDRLVPRIGVMSAGIFAAQMVNLPLFGLPMSGHMIGAVLAAVLLGPWGATVAITAVLTVQCLVFMDGGLASLGANVMNLAVIGGMGGYWIYASIRKSICGPRGTLVAAVVASWLIVPVSAVAAAAELAPGVEVSFSRIGTMMLMYHLAVGIIEAVGTGLVVSWVLKTRPDLIYGSSSAGPTLRAASFVSAGLAVALSLAAFAAPWASEHPDALEKVASGHLGLSPALSSVSTWWQAPFPDYAPAGEPSQGGLWQQAQLATAVLGVLGTLVTFAVAAGMSALVRVGSDVRSAHAS